MRGFYGTVPWASRFQGRPIMGAAPTEKERAAAELERKRGLLMRMKMNYGRLAREIGGPAAVQALEEAIAAFDRAEQRYVGLGGRVA